MRTILDNPAAFIPHNKESANLKTRMQSSFKLIDNKLYKQSDIRHLNPRYVVLKAEVFDIIIQEHLKLLHASCNKVSKPTIKLCYKANYIKVWPTIKQQYYRIKREDVTFILKRCKNCTLNRSNITKALLVPIITRRA